MSTLMAKLRRRLNSPATDATRDLLDFGPGEVPSCDSGVPSVRTFDNICYLMYTDKQPSVCVRNVDDSLTPIEIYSPDDSVICTGHLVIDAVNLKDVNSYLLNHFVFKPDTLHIQNCDVSSSFFKRLSKKVELDSVTAVIIDAINPGIVNFKDLFTTMPCLTALKLENVCSSTWMADIQTFQGEIKLSKLIVSTLLRSDEAWNIDEVLAFLKAQQPGFRLDVRATNRSSSCLTPFTDALSQRLPSYRGVGCPADRHIVLRHQDENYTFYLTPIEAPTVPEPRKRRQSTSIAPTMGIDAKRTKYTMKNAVVIA
uniref:Recep_L_domain domain-containing protein n=1 Tax=Panagrellus redivivus TaxID=6233 RepID=A0A7E4UUL3_PANRE